MHAIYKRLTLDPKTTNRLKVKGQRKLFPANSN